MRRNRWTKAQRTPGCVVPAATLPHRYHSSPQVGLRGVPSRTGVPESSVHSFSVAAQLSILVVSWNTSAKTVACLDSIGVGLREAIPSETIVVENGSTDGSAEILARRSDIRLVANSDNRGFAAAVNQAYALARGDLILLLNSEFAVRPGRWRPLSSSSTSTATSPA